MVKNQAENKLKHERKRQLKQVSFRIDTESELLEFANSVDFSKWVKTQIQSKLNNKG